MKLKMLIFAVAVMIMLPNGVLAAPKTADDAKQMVAGWLKRDPRPLGALLGQRVKDVQTFKDVKGEPLYHVVYLDPSGFVIVPADDMVEPIIAFVPTGRYDPSPNNPLGALISGDLPKRMAFVRSLKPAKAAAFQKAKDKWNELGASSPSSPIPAGSPEDASGPTCQSFIHKRSSFDTGSLESEQLF